MEDQKASQDKGEKKNIYALGAVSFFTDVSSEMIYPLLPDLLKSLGAGSMILGLVEGVAEATASLMKAGSGWFSDRFRKRKLPVFVGYAMSGLAKPLLALAGSWPLILFIRFFDRMGKGVRTAPRDALLADSSPPGQTGKSFGLHRAMDTLGAVLGPALAFIFISQLEWKLSWLFLFAAIPAALGLIVILALVREVPPRKVQGETFKFSFKNMSPGFKRFVLVSALFSLGHFPSVFLVLRCRELGVSMALVTVVYLAYNLVYSIVALPAGSLSDRVGRRKLLIGSYFLFALVFGLGALASSWWQAVLVFMGYGVFQGFYEGAHRSFCADLEPSERRASSYGVLHAMIGLAALPAGIIAGALWQLGPVAAFSFSALIALLSAVIFAAVIPERLCSRS